MSKYKPGDKIMVKVGGIDYETFIDEHGVQRFKKNQLMRHLVDSGQVNLNQLCMDYADDKFSQREFAEFNMAIGYSVCGFAELSFFEDMDIDNPAWSESS